MPLAARRMVKRREPYGGVSTASPLATRGIAFAPIPRFPAVALSDAGPHAAANGLAAPGSETNIRGLRIASDTTERAIEAGPLWP
jgi:hypothetical protein